MGNANVFDIPLSGTDETLGDRILELYEKEGQEISKKPSLGIFKIVAMDPVKAAVDAMMGQCTMVMIVHRMATIRKCDMIFKLSPGGEIKAYNGYDEMMKDETA